MNLGHESLFQIVEYQDKLVITHGNSYYLDSEKYSISIYDPKSGESRNYAVESALNQVAVKDGVLYALDQQEYAIYVYDMDGKGDALELKGKCELKSRIKSHQMYILSAAFL